MDDKTVECNTKSAAPYLYKINLYGRGGQTFWPVGQIYDCLATGGPDTVRFA